MNIRNSRWEGYFSNTAMQFSKLGNKDIPDAVDIPFPKKHNVFQENGGRISYLGVIINFTQYREGFIYFHEVESNAIAMSYEFSGCAMAKVTMKNGRMYVFHIFLNNDRNDCRRYWNSFVRNGITDRIISDIILFKPFEPFRPNLRSMREFTIGVIDTNNKCLSIKMEKIQSANNTYGVDLRGGYIFDANSRIKPKRMYEAVIF